MTTRDEQGFSLIELLIVLAIITIIAAIAIPGLLRSRMTGNEVSAIASLRVTSSGQLAYSASCGRGAYAACYVVLGTPPPGGNDAFVSSDLGSVLAPQKSGFDFALVAGAGSSPGPNDCNGNATVSAFLATGVPMMFGTTGTRSFAVNGGHAIWAVSAAAAPAEPFAAPAVPIQ